MFHSTLKTVQEALTSEEEDEEEEKLAPLPSSIAKPVPTKPVIPTPSSSLSTRVGLGGGGNTNHGVTMVETKSKEVTAALDVLYHGTTVLHFDADSNQAIPVFLKMERCNGTMTWCRPPWGDPRKRSTASLSSAASSSGSGSGATGATGVAAASIDGNSEDPLGSGFMNSSGGQDSLDSIEDAVSPGLKLKYTNRSGESLAYADEGFIDLAHMKSLTVKGDEAVNAMPESARLIIHKNFQGSVEPTVLRIVYGSSLSENRTVQFVCPPDVGAKWIRVLPKLTTAIKREDNRMVWLKDQYLFLYYQDDLCMGPLAADAIKVRQYKYK